MFQRCVFNLKGVDVKCPHAEEIVYTIKERQYTEHIENAYSYASQLLLRLLIDDKQLMARLRFVNFVFYFYSLHFVSLPWKFQILQLSSYTENV